MGTPSSRPRSGCCGLCSALQQLCCASGQSSSRALQRERRRAEIAIFLTGGPALVVADQPTATLCLHSCRLARSAKLWQCSGPVLASYTAAS